MKLIAKKQCHLTVLLTNNLLILIVSLFFVMTTVSQKQYSYLYCPKITISEAYVLVATSHTTKYSTSTQQQTHPQSIVVRNRFILPSFITTKLTAASSNDNDNDDIDNDFDVPLQSNNIDASRDMVSKFYKEVSERESGRSSPPDTSRNDSNPSTTKFTGGSSSSRQVNPNVYDEQQDTYSINRKTRENSANMFTSSISSSSSSLFDNDRPNRVDGSMSSSSASYGMNRQDEFIAVNRFEQTLVVQAIFIVVSLIFVVSVGMTGGITDGSDRYNEETDNIDDIMFQYNNIDPSQIIVIPAPSSSETISQSSPASSINDQSLLQLQQQQEQQQQQQSPTSKTSTTTKSAWI